MRVQDIKHRNQNLFDFVLSNYGSLEYISNFLKDNAQTSVLQYDSYPLNYKFAFGVKTSQVINFYNKKDYIVITGGNSLDSDFNSDFNEDFF